MLIAKKVEKYRKPFREKTSLTVPLLICHNCLLFGMFASNQFLCPTIVTVTRSDHTAEIIFYPAFFYLMLQTFSCVGNIFLSASFFYDFMMDITCTYCNFLSSSSIVGLFSCLHIFHCNTSVNIFLYKSLKCNDFLKLDSQKENYWVQRKDVNESIFKWNFELLIFIHGTKVQRY